MPATGGFGLRFRQGKPPKLARRFHELSQFSNRIAHLVGGRGARGKTETRRRSCSQRSHPQLLEGGDLVEVFVHTGIFAKVPRLGSWGFGRDFSFKSRLFRRGALTAPCRRVARAARCRARGLRS